MSKQLNDNEALSVTKKLLLVDFISEEFSNRVQNDDFVWIDMPVAQEAGRGDNSPNEMKTENQPNVGCRDVANVVQCVSYAASPEDEVVEQSDYDSDLEGMLEAEYNNKCVKNKSKQFIRPKIKYSLPYQLNMQNCATYNCGKTKQTDRPSKEQKKDLPKIKFDETTTAVLNMLVNNRYLGQYNELISTGKSSVVFHANCNRRPCMPMPYENAVKIYKTSKHEDRNNIVYKKVQREFQHLHSLKFTKPFFTSTSTPCPVRAWKNVIVMSFIGFRNQVAMSIQDLPPGEDQEMYNAIIEFIDKCYNKGNLVHGRLSPNKILLWLRKKPCFIGWSHSVKKDHPLALTKLIKDCHFVTEFYKRRGLSVKPTINLVQQITGQNITNEEFLEIIEGKKLYDKYEKNPNRKNTNLVKQTINRFKS